MAKYSTYITTADGRRIEFTLDRGRRKNAALAISEGRLIVRVPMNADPAQIHRFIEEHADWIEENLAKSAKQSGLPQRFADGETFRILGEWVTITAVAAEKYFPPKIEDGRLLIAVCGSTDSGYMARQVQSFIIECANREITESMRRLTKLMGLYPSKITVKDLSASWGRCNSKGNISINYKVVSYSKAHIDYVCIHELSHLVHMDHSADFWALVERYCPDWRQIRSSMRVSADEE